jgi:DNA-binding NarL/FixJ family response regulator
MLVTGLTAQTYARRGVSQRDETIRVVLADDHVVVREGLRLLLRSAPDISVVGEASNGEGAVALARQHTPDVLVLDLDMPGGDGASTLDAIQSAVPTVRVLILTMHAERDRLLPVLEAGACGYLSKSSAASDLIEAVRVVASGEVYVRPVAARLLATALVPKRADESARGRYRTLSERERTILLSVAQGYNGAEIARRLAISSKTVDAYKRRVEVKLGLGHRTDYVRFACDAGILGGP